MRRLVIQMAPFLIGATSGVSIWLKIERGKMGIHHAFLSNFPYVEDVSDILLIAGYALIGAGLLGFLCSIGKSAFGDDFEFDPIKERPYLWERSVVTLPLISLGVMTLMSGNWLN